MRLLPVILFSALFATSAIAAEDEYFGEFLDSLKGIFLTDAKPRPKFKLESEFRFKDPNGLLWVTPALKEVDGASIPQTFWSFIGGPFEGEYINASVIHDHYCDVKTRTAHDTHRAFYYGMRAAKVSDWKAKFMYWAVATFGPDWKLEKRVKFKSICSQLEAKIVCSQVPEFQESLMITAVVDLQNPEVLAAALSKADSVARTLKTTNGRVLDVSAGGQILASLDNIAQNSNNYKTIFVAKLFVTDPSQLGVLSQWQNAKFDEVKEWENYKIPKFSDAVILSKRNVQVIETGKQFKVDIKGQPLLRDRLKLESLGSISVHK